MNKYFNIFTCDNEVTNSKPDTDIFIKTADKLKIKPQNCLVIEDSENGKIAAKKAKMKRRRKEWKHDKSSRRQNRSSSYEKRSKSRWDSDSD